MTKSRKPRVRPESIIWLERIYKDASEIHWATDDNLVHAPSDILDGWAIPRDLRDLVRRRILYVCPIPADERLPLSPVTWGFTERGIRLMRAWREQAPLRLAEEYHSGPSCPNCGSPI